MRIRDATPTDAEAVRSVHAISIAGLEPAGYSQEQVEAWARRCESADYVAAIRETDEFLVAEPAGDVVGFGSQQYGTTEGYESPAHAEIMGIYVHPTVSRDGIGTALYRDLEKRARSRDGRDAGATCFAQRGPVLGGDGLPSRRRARPRVLERPGHGRDRHRCRDDEGPLTRKGL